MDVTTLPIEEIEEMNLRCADIIAVHAEELEERLKPPLAQLATFEHFLPGRRVLDAGCGWGRYAHEFPERKMEYLGVDHSPKMLEVARRRNPGLTFQQMNLRELAFPDASFDGIWCCCALGGNPKRYTQQVLAGFFRTLVPGGALFLMHVDLGESSESVEGTQLTEAGDMYHAYWELDEFRNELETAGFSIKKCLPDLRSGTLNYLGVKPQI